MINIKVKKAKTKSLDLIEPVEMLGTPHGTVFQQYAHDMPTKNFWISCGGAEEAMINIFYSDDPPYVQEYRLSTDDIESLLDFLPHIKARQIEADVKIGLKI